MTPASRPTPNLALLAMLLIALLGSAAPARGGGLLSGGGGGGQGGLPFLGDDGVGGIDRTGGSGRLLVQGRLAGGGPIVPLTDAPGRDTDDGLTTIDLGQGLPADSVTPRLDADDQGLLLTESRSGATAVVILGLEAIDLPFHGGVLVPHPDLVLRAQAVADEGALRVPLAWATLLPSGTTLLAQIWTVRDGIPAASNALALFRR